MTCHLIAPPLLSCCISPITDKWVYLMQCTFNTKVDLSLCLPHIWNICVPPSLCELIWKVIFGSLPIGSSWTSNKVSGLDFCLCRHSKPTSIFHISSGCSYFPISCLYTPSLCPALFATMPGCASHISPNPEHWFCLWWFPILCFKCLAACSTSAQSCSLLCKTVWQHEWIYVSFLWELWCTCMKMAHKPGFFLSLDSMAASLGDHYVAFLG